MTMTRNCNDADDNLKERCLEEDQLLQPQQKERPKDMQKKTHTKYAHGNVITTTRKSYSSSSYYAVGQDFYDDHYYFDKNEEEEHATATNKDDYDSRSSGEASIQDYLDFDHARQTVTFPSREEALQHLHRLYQVMYQHSVEKERQQRQEQDEEDQRRQQKHQQHIAVTSAISSSSKTTEEIPSVEINQEHQVLCQSENPYGNDTHKHHPSQSKIKHKREKRKRRGKCSSCTPDEPTNINTKSMIMIRGRSGTGKTTLVHQFYQQLIHQGQGSCKSGPTNSTATPTPSSSSFPKYDCPTSCGCYQPYFLTGKFNEQQHDNQRNNDPLSAIVDAFQGFLRQILHPETPWQERQRIRDSILKHVIMDHNPHHHSHHHSNHPHTDNDNDISQQGCSHHILLSVFPALRTLLYGNNDHDIQEEDPTTTKTFKNESHFASCNSTELTTSTTGELSTTVPTSHQQQLQKPQEGFGQHTTEGQPQRPEPAPSLSSPILDNATNTNTRNQLKYVLMTFCNAIATRERPVIFFLDDLQWCDCTSEDILETLWSDLAASNITYFYFIGAYRSIPQQQLAVTVKKDDEYYFDHCPPNHPSTTTTPSSLLSSSAAPDSASMVQNRWWTTITHLEQQHSATLTTIDLPNLTLNELTQFVAAALHMNDGRNDIEEEEDDDNDDSNQSLLVQQRLQQLQEELVSIIYQKTKGNLFFSKQILEQLHRQGWLEFSRMTFQWEWQHVQAAKTPPPPHQHHQQQQQSEKNDIRTSTLEDILSDNVLQAVTAKLHSLTPALQHVLCVAAYTTKSSWDLDTMYELLRYQQRYHDDNPNNSRNSNKTLVVSSLEELISLLDGAVLQGLLANSTGSKNYSFEHDRIQQAAFGLVPKGQVRDQFRLSMGLALLAMATRNGTIPLYRVANHQEWMLFASADHLNASSFLYRMQQQHQPKKQDLSPNQEEQYSMLVLSSDRDGDDGDTLTVLNCHVGYLAANKAAYEAAGKYLNLALQELVRVYENPWDVQYKLTLKIYTKKVDVELWQGHFEKGRATAEQISTMARHCNDRLPTQLALAKAFGREEKHTEALRMAVNALQSLKIYPGGPLRKFASLTRNLLFVKRYFRRKRDDEIVSLPLMTDPRYLMAMEFMSVASYQAYYVGNLPEFLVMCLLMLRTTTSHGLCGQSAVALIGYALVCNNLNDMEGAHRFSALSRQVLEQTKAKHLEAIQMLVVAHWITGWRDPHPQVLTIFERGYRSGMETGDFENALLCLTSGYHHEYAAGYPLSILDTKYAKLAERLRMYKIDAILVMSLEQWRKIQYLMGRNNFGREPIDVNELGKFGPERQNDGSEKYRLLYGYLCRLELAVYFESFEFAEIMAEKTLEVDSDKSFSTNSLRLFFSGLTYASLVRRTKNRRCRRIQYSRKARRCYQELKSLCDIKGLNSWHRCMVLEAHLKGMDGGREESRVEATYDRAVQCALRSGHVQDAALACHLAGMYFHNLNNTAETVKDSILIKSRDHLAVTYLQKARGYYLQWGAFGLIRHLEMQYPTLLPPLSRFNDSTSSKLSSAVSDAETATIPSQSNVMAASCYQDGGGSVGLSSMNEDDLISAMTDP